MITLLLYNSCCATSLTGYSFLAGICDDNLKVVDVFKGFDSRYKKEHIIKMLPAVEDEDGTILPLKEFIEKKKKELEVLSSNSYGTVYYNGRRVICDKNI